MNSAEFIGHLGADAEMRYTAEGTAMCTFSVGVNERRGEEQTTLWVRAVLFGERAEKLAPYLVRAKHVFVRGRITERQWQDDDGAEHRAWNLVVDSIELLGGGERTEGAAPAPQQQRPNQQQARPPGNRGGGQRQYGSNSRPQGNRGGYR